MEVRTIVSTNESTMGLLLTTKKSVKYENESEMWIKTKSWGSKCISVSREFHDKNSDS